MMIQGFAIGERVRVNFGAHGVATVWLTRPDRLNALDAAMFAALTEAGERLHADPSLRCVVLAGEGRGFSSGLDLSVMEAFSRGEAPALAERSHGNANLYQQAALVWRKLPVPVIAVVHGVCMGGALQIAAGADIRIAAPGTRLAVMELDWGLVPDMGHFVLWRGVVRGDVLRRMTFTAQGFSGEQALAMGFVTELAEDPLDRALALAEDIAAKSPHAVRAAKTLFATAQDHAMDAVLMAESVEQQRLLGSPSQQEAARSRIEGRSPQFRDC